MMVRESYRIPEEKNTRKHQTSTEERNENSGPGAPPGRRFDFFAASAFFALSGSCGDAASCVTIENANG